MPTTSALFPLTMNATVLNICIPGHCARVEADSSFFLGVFLDARVEMNAVAAIAYMDKSMPNDIFVDHVLPFLSELGKRRCGIAVESLRSGHCMNERMVLDTHACHRSRKWFVETPLRNLILCVQ